MTLLWVVCQCNLEETTGIVFEGTGVCGVDDFEGAHSIMLTIKMFLETL